MTKLTLSMEDNLIEFAKSFAKTQKTSLSQMITTYLKSLFWNKSKPANDIHPSVQKMAGVLSHLKPISKKELRKEYHEHLLKKHL